ncbi:MAG: HaeII family restriction endonuclease [Candidatus Methanoplasma sp.]|jgi:type II restriction enzyme|nr:HaeII family restriction endonuclease [Candidatus Methanoplasma sp.]
MTECKQALDTIIRKSRIHLYKPIQIAEILYAHRTGVKFNPLDLESYRNESKKWRDTVTNRLVGRASTSSQKFQDNLFGENAISPRLLKGLCDINESTGGMVEAYIYFQFQNKLSEVSEAAEYVRNTEYERFDLRCFISMFSERPGLKRSIDKVFEIVVYALFETIVETLDVKIRVEVNPSKKDIAKEFEEFSRLVLGIEVGLSNTDDATFYRVGVTNAADRGLDMWANFGPAIQVKHISLDLKTAANVVTGIESNRIIIVCKTCDERTIKSIVSQIGIRIRGIVTEETLDSWYDIALRGKYSDMMGELLMDYLLQQMSKEFPSQDGSLDEFMKGRGYDKKDITWETGAINPK